MAFTEILPPGGSAKVRRATATTAARDAPPDCPSPSAIKLAGRLGLEYVTNAALTLRRQRKGKGFSYLTAQGHPIRDSRTVRRLKSLAVPPAYENVRYADNPQAHLQAVGRDAAGRLQYRYHPEWQKVREMRKASRLARFAEALPRIRRSIGQHLSGEEPTREFALACVIELVAHSAIRPGSENYARIRGTRGAATLLKSNVIVDGETVTLSFKAKGGRKVQKEFRAPRLCVAIETLKKLSGRRLFQYRGQNGDVRHATAHDVNEFLREIAGADISLKDFRTLLASVQVLDALAREQPAVSKRGRRRQVLEAIRAAAEELANTPTICAKSYVHESVVTAFEEGVLEQFAETLKSCRSGTRREQVLAQVIATAAAA